MRIRDRFDSEGHVADFLTCFVFEKEGGIKDVIHHLKYKNIRSIGERLGHEAGALIMASPSFSDADYLLPVPLHKLTLRERGYNQSEHISSGISEITHIPKVTSFLARKKYTRSQTKLDPVERNRNVEGAFEVPEGSRQFVKGKKLILVDDVITTGSTLGACAAELKRNGALRVLVVSAAIAGQRLS
jgi:ComF family protein